MRATITDVELLYSPGCPHLELARFRLAQALEIIGAEGVRVRPREVPVESESQVPGWGGSPTILVVGVDLFDQGEVPVGAACRLYMSSAGAEGAPSLEHLVAALSSRRSKYEQPADRRV